MRPIASRVRPSKKGTRASCSSRSVSGSFIGPGEEADTGDGQRTTPASRSLQKPAREFESAAPQPGHGHSLLKRGSPSGSKYWTTWQVVNAAGGGGGVDAAPLEEGGAGEASDAAGRVAGARWAGPAEAVARGAVDAATSGRSGAGGEVVASAGLGADAVAGASGGS